MSADAADDKDKLDDIIKVALDLWEQRGTDNLEIRLPHVTIKVSRPIEERVLTRHSFTESLNYLRNARRHIKHKTPEGFSDCKGNCRNALVSALQVLTGKGGVREATKELANRGLLGEREQEFIEVFDKLLRILHGVDSKRGSHPPMTRNQADAEFALKVTQSVIEYLINQATTPRI